VVSKTSPQLFQPARWLVTGGCGFIGCNLIKRLISEGAAHIRILDNLSVGTRSDLSRVCTFTESCVEELHNVPPSSILTPHFSPVHLLVGDIRDPDTCLAAAHGTDIIVHLAANTGVAPSVENPRMDMEINVIGTLNMLEAARQSSVKRFIFASSGAPVGECEPPIHEELAPHPVSPYGASKLAGEGYCSAYYRTFSIETVSLRFGNVYGPLSSHKSSIVAKFIRQALAGEVCEIYGDGNQTRDFIYIDDLVEAIIKVAVALSLSLRSVGDNHENDHGFSPLGSYQLTRKEIGDRAFSARPSSFSARPSSMSLGKVAGELFQVATNNEHTVNEVAAMLFTELKQHGTDMRIAHGHPRLGDVKRNFSDIRKARRLLNWSAQTHIEKGLRQTVEWFLSL